MRKILSLLIVLTFLALLSVPVSARTCGNLRHRHGNYWHTHYACVGDGHKHGRSFWQKHRDKLTTAGASARARLSEASPVVKKAQLSEPSPAAVARLFIPTAFASGAEVLATKL